jgi:hypothetical protein
LAKPHMFWTTARRGTSTWGIYSSNGSH